MCVCVCAATCLMSLRVYLSQLLKYTNLNKKNKQRKENKTKNEGFHRVKFVSVLVVGVDLTEQLQWVP